MIAAFDVDGCLIDDEDRPRHEVIDLLRALHALGYEIVVWSGGGVPYAERWVDRLGLGELVSAVLEKGHEWLDVVVDDEVVDLGWANIRVPLRPIKQQEGTES